MGGGIRLANANTNMVGDQGTVVLRDDSISSRSRSRSCNRSRSRNRSNTRTNSSNVDDSQLEGHVEELSSDVSEILFNNNS